MDKYASRTLKHACSILESHLNLTLSLGNTNGKIGLGIEPPFELLFHLNKPTYSWVAVRTTVAHNKSKQHSLNAKVNFSLVLPYT